MRSDGDPSCDFFALSPQLSGALAAMRERSPDAVECGAGIRLDVPAAALEIQRRRRGAHRRRRIAPGQPSAILSGTSAQMDPHLLPASAPAGREAIARRSPHGDATLGRCSGFRPAAPVEFPDQSRQLCLIHLTGSASAALSALRWFFYNDSCGVRAHALADWRLEPAPKTTRPKCPCTFEK